MNQIFKYSIFFVISVFLLSCNNDELVQKHENLSQVKKELSLTKFSNVNIAVNVEVKWERVNETKKDNLKIYQIAVKEKQQSRLQSTFLQEYLKYQIISIESRNQTDSYFVEVYGDNDSVVYPESIDRLANFTGTFNVYLLNGENLGSVAIFNGKARNISKNDRLNQLTTVINSFAATSVATNKIPLCDKSYTQVVYQDADKYEIWSVGSTIVALKYVGMVRTKTTTILPYPCDGSGDRDAIILQRIAQYTHGAAGAAGGEANVKNTIITDPSFANNPCLVRVFTKLGGSPTFQTYLKQFNSKFSVANLKLAAGNKGLEGITAQTSPPVNSEIVITFNDSRLNRPALDIARTFMHEIIHAEMFRQLLNLAKTDGSIDANEITRIAILPNSNELLEYYGYYTEGPQHELMAIRYRETIISFLKQVDNSLTQKQYEAIAWQGLQGTAAWNKMTANEMADIQNTYEGWKNVTPNNCN